MNISDVLYAPDEGFDLNLPVVTKKFYTDSESNPIQIVFLGDIHIGAKVTDEAFVEKIAERLKKPNTYWVDMGDACEMINMQDKRFNIRDVAEWAVNLDGLVDLPKMQMERYAEIFKPVADRCICRVKGNHEDMMVVRQERDVYKELANKCGISKSTFLGYSGFLRLVCQVKCKNGQRKGGWTVTGYLTHGHGGGKLAGGKALNLERLALAYDADFYAFAHTHTKMHIEKRMIACDRTMAYDKLKCAFIVGSCRRGISSYEKRAGYYPQGLGPYELWIWPESKKMKLIG